MASTVPLHWQALADSKKCTVCEVDGRPDKQADVWCVQCQESLCSACIPYHSRYKKSHTTVGVQQTKSWSRALQTESLECSADGAQMELLCLDSCLAKCTNCIRQCESLGQASPRLLKVSEDLGRVLAEILTAKAEAENNISIAQRQLDFGPASNSIVLSFTVDDLSVTSEGHVLLAALRLGMLEYDMSRQMLSSWQAPDPGNGYFNPVSTVVALDDGRAVVGLYNSKLLVLLQRSSADRAAWLVERHVAELQSPPIQMSVLGDVVALVLMELWNSARRLQLVRLSTGQSLYSESTDYDIYSVALTAAGVVTTSLRPVKLSDGREVYVVDCCSHRGERLWRHELRDNKVASAVCAVPAGQLYVCVMLGKETDDWSTDCVRAIDREDGKTVADVLAKSCHDEHHPWRLSLSRGQQQQVLAVLSRDRGSYLFRVTVHPAVNSRDRE